MAQPCRAASGLCAPALLPATSMPSCKTSPAALSCSRGALSSRAAPCTHTHTRNQIQGRIAPSVERMPAARCGARCAPRLAHPSTPACACAPPCSAGSGFLSAAGPARPRFSASTSPLAYQLYSGKSAASLAHKLHARNLRSCAALDVPVHAREVWKHCPRKGATKTSASGCTSQVCVPMLRCLEGRRLQAGAHSQAAPTAAATNTMAAAMLRLLASTPPALTEKTLLPRTLAGNPAFAGNPASEMLACKRCPTLSPAPSPPACPPRRAPTTSRGCAPRHPQPLPRPREQPPNTTPADRAFRTRSCRPTPPPRPATTPPRRHCAPPLPQEHPHTPGPASAPPAACFPEFPPRSPDRGHSAAVLPRTPPKPRPRSP